MVVNRLDKIFKQKKAAGDKVLIAYLAAAYPKFPEQETLLKTLVDSGVDVIELGIPFSDPIADGPTIQFASERALENGVSLRKILAWLKTWPSALRSTPVVLMGYLNPLEQFGLDRFARAARAAGVSGVIVPDLIPEEAMELRKALSKQQIHLIHLVAPTTPRERQKRIAKLSGGFLYAVSVTGVTGARRKLPVETKQWLATLRRESPRPVCVGFGISGPEQVRALRSSVDGFIVGSALIDLIRKNKKGQRNAPVGRFAKQLSRECHRGR